MRSNDRSTRAMAMFFLVGINGEVEERPRHLGKSGVRR